MGSPFHKPAPCNPNPTLTEAATGRDERKRHAAQQQALRDALRRREEFHQQLLQQLQQETVRQAWAPPLHPIAAGASPAGVYTITTLGD